MVGEYLYKFAIIEGRNRLIDEEAIAIFVEGLSDLSANRIKQGMAEYLREGKGFPWPSEIRELGEL